MSTALRALLIYLIINKYLITKNKYLKEAFSNKYCFIIIGLIKPNYFIFIQIIKYRINLIKLN